MKKTMVLLNVFMLFAFVSYSQNSLNNMLSYFNETELPIYGEDITYSENKNSIPQMENSLFNVSSNEQIEAYYKFPIYEKFTGLLFAIKDDYYPILKLIIINNEGLVISETSIKYNPKNEIDFIITTDLIIQYYKMEQGRFSIYENYDGCGVLLTASDPFEIIEDMYKINPDGKVSTIDSYAAKECVQNYIENLSTNLIKRAYNLQKNKKWGSFEHFSSKKAFGGINYIVTSELKYISGDNKTAKIYFNGIYYDSTNGDSDIKQNFILTKISGKWYITDMKVISFSKRKCYTEKNKELKYLDFRLTNITGENFDFYIEAVSEEECNDDSNGNIYVMISGKAEYTDYNQAVFTDGDCSLYFFFGEDEKELTLTAYKYAKKYKNLSIILNKDFKIHTFK